MKHYLSPIISQFRNDRSFLFLLAALITTGVVYIIYVSIALAPTDLQVATRYTAFGNVQYYRDQWFYLLSFVGFGGIATVIHAGMAIKLYIRNMRSLAFGFGWLGLILMLIMFLIARSVIGIAYLS